MSKLMLVANADSPLLVDRVGMSLNVHDNVVWYSESYQRPTADCRIYHYQKKSFLGPLNKIVSACYFLYVYWREKPDILHVHWALFTPLIFKKNWNNLIVSVMGSDVNLPGMLGDRRLFARIAFNRATVITSKSSDMDVAINKLGDYSEKISRFTWGVTEEFFSAKDHRSSVLSSLGIPDNALVIFSPRSIQALYRIPAIVQAFISFSNQNKGAYLLISEMNSNISIAKEIDSIINNSKVSDRIVRLGRLDYREMVNCYAAADIVMSYAQHDGMPQSLYEAMAAGCFPIFTDLPCYQEILQNEENALLCDTNDSDDLLRKLKCYQQQYMGDAAHQIVNSNRIIIRKKASRLSEHARLLSLYQSLKGASINIELP